MSRYRIHLNGSKEHLHEPDGVHQQTHTASRGSLSKCDPIEGASLPARLSGLLDVPGEKRKRSILRRASKSR